jgi:hypothetical protein
MQFLSTAHNIEVNNVTIDNLLDALQQAIGIEVATIPLYLHTYYSIKRDLNPEDIARKLRKGRFSDDTLSQIMNLKGYKALDVTVREKFSEYVEQGGCEKDELIKLLSASIAVNVNKMAAQIYSVVVEEMLHVALASNVLSGLKVETSEGTKIGAPKLYCDGILPTWPFNWAGHVPEVILNLRKLSPEQLMSFLDVESPCRLPKNKELLAATIDFTTIGDFYKAIIEVIGGNEVSFVHAPRLDPGKGYYVQNNINSTYYDLYHRPVFENRESSGDLLALSGNGAKKYAIESLKIIIHQGEGAPETSWDGKTIQCDEVAETTDELSHFIKFGRMHCVLQFIQEVSTVLDIDDITPTFISNSVPNPTTKETYGHSKALQALSDVTNAAFSYIFVMLDRCYSTSDDKEKEEVFISVHKSMMWIISTLCQDLMPNITFTKDEQTYSMSPTFEFCDFKNNDDMQPKAYILHLIAQAQDEAQNDNNMSQEIRTKIVHTLDNIATRVATLEDVALPQHYS